MPGNYGFFRLAPGQVTDDSELAMCQLHALASMPLQEFNAIKLAEMYRLWYLS